MTTEDKNKNWDFEIIKKCPILYCGVNKTLQESLIPFGFECGYGWKEPLWKASCALEELNMRYWPKYKIRVQAMQVKEKFGTLHFYYDIIKDSAWYKRIPHDFFCSLSRILRKIDYRYVRMQDEAPYVEHIVEELKTKEEYLKEKRYAQHISNVKVEEKDGKWVKCIDLQHYGKYHNEPTKHKLLHKVMSLAQRLSILLDSYGEELSRQQEVIAECMSNKASKIIHVAENECYDRCELCGASISERGWRRRCETTGWISYICDECAKKHDGGYYMDNDYYEGDKLVKTKEEVDKEKAEIEAKWKEKEEKYNAENDMFEKELEAAREEDKKTGRTLSDESEK